MQTDRDRCCAIYIHFDESKTIGKERREGRTKKMTLSTKSLEMMVLMSSRENPLPGRGTSEVETQRSPGFRFIRASSSSRKRFRNMRRKRRTLRDATTSSVRAVAKYENTGTIVESPNNNRKREGLGGTSLERLYITPPSAVQVVHSILIFFVSAPFTRENS